MAAKIEVWGYGIGHGQHLIKDAKNRSGDLKDVEFLVLVGEFK